MLEGKVALVAGAGRGIAIELGAAGATVYCTGRSAQRSEMDRPEMVHNLTHGHMWLKFRMQANRRMRPGIVRVAVQGPKVESPPSKVQRQSLRADLGHWTLDFHGGRVKP
ncbi:MAG TPA: hypothetical protein VNO50_09710 [Pyrinomonadaceae bacterium]|nr:hypothetical protein [Pyrinomonadaceae bacterium]